MAYEKDGVEYPSVTMITGMINKPMLLVWSANCAVDYISDHLEAVRDIFDVHRGEEVLKDARTAYKTVSKYACDSGTQCHKAIEAYIGGKPYEEILETEEAINGFAAFKDWEKMNHVEWLESEVQIVSERIGYAGRFDAIAKVNEHRYLIDFKTSKGIYDEMKWQLCAYRQAYNESPDCTEPIENLAILHLDKFTAEPTFKPIIKNLERMTELFNSLVHVYYLMKNRRLKNNPFVKQAKGECVSIF